jgi:F-type H+-transporting ATPase subunit alpha
VQGLVVTIGNGVINLQGLLVAFVGELFMISCGTNAGADGGAEASFGVTVNIYRDLLWNLHVGGLVLTQSRRISEGSKVFSMGSLLTLSIGDHLFGTSIIDGLGNIILNSCRIDSKYKWLIEAPAAAVIERQSVFEPLLTGVICIDTIVPVGRGQRELVIGDRQTGKTSIGVDTILNQRFEKVFCVFVPIGQKSTSIIEVFMSIVSRDASFYVTFVVSGASSSAVSQYLSPYSGASLSEFFMYICEQSVFMFIDDLSKHAGAYREISLLLRRPPGREAYPGEIFFVHSRLLERSAKLAPSIGRGSLSCFPVIETLAGDLGAYIATNVISITDGQISLSQELYNSGILPCIDVGLSVTRVGSSAQWDGMKLFGGTYKLELAQFVELQTFSQFSSDLPEDTRLRLERSTRVVEMLKQSNGSTIALSYQVGLLSSANTAILNQILSISSISSLINYFCLFPIWVFLIIAPRVL